MPDRHARLASTWETPGGRSARATTGAGDHDFETDDGIVPRYVKVSQDSTIVVDLYTLEEDRQEAVPRFFVKGYNVERVVKVYDEGSDPGVTVDAYE